MIHRILYLCLAFFVAFFVLVPNTTAISAFPYRLKKGDNFQSLAKRFYFVDSEKKIKITVSAKQIAQENRSKKLKPNSIIEIPIKEELLFPYYIERGETLISLSLKTGLKIKTIRRWLGNLPLYAGRNLYLPLLDDHLKKKTRSERKITTPVSLNLNAIKKNEDEKSSEEKKPGWRRVINGDLSHIITMAKKNKVNFLFPANLQITDPYGITDDILQSSLTYEIDNEADQSHTIFAAEEGVVDLSQTLRGLGHTVIIVHQGGFHSLYAGLKKPFKNHGDFVLRGEALGETTNNFTFALYYRGIPFDPIRYQGLINKKR